jgi:hypothetical protein
MANTSYVLLEKITVGAAGASSVTFSGIPQTGYTDLVVKYSIKSTTANQNTDGLGIKINTSTANFTRKALFGTGSVAASTGASDTYLGFADGASATNTFSNGELYIPNYAGSNYKSISSDNVAEANQTEAYAFMTALLWSQTTAISSLSFYFFSGDVIAANSTFYLYGVAKLGTTPAIQPYATGGDTIMTDGTYWYHAFKASGTFTPSKTLSCDYLVVAGGGGGASGSATPGGGGGAGGYLTATGLSVTSATTVTVGAGGAGGSAAADNRGAKGSDSVFSVTATGGGYGAENQISGGSGGSGGGGSYATGSGGAASPAGQGNAGGAGSGGTNQGSGAGGGAGAAGGAGTTTTGGAGGAGLNTLSSWFSTTGTGASGYVAGGGGGSVYNGGTPGTGGAGGGGAGAYNAASNAGTANTGGGGGATGGNGTRYAAGNGGSGLVIVRYAV